LLNHECFVDGILSDSGCQKTPVEQFFLRLGVCLLSLGCFELQSSLEKMVHAFKISLGRFLIV